MVIDHSNTLHERVTDCRSNKATTQLFERSRHCFGLRCFRRDTTHRLVDFTSRWRECPQHVGKTIQFNTDPGILNHRFQLAAMADNAGIRQPFLYLLIAAFCQFPGVELTEHGTHMVTLSQHGYPGQPCLHAFQYQPLEQCIPVVNRHTPLLIVIANIEFIVPTPGTTIPVVLSVVRFHLYSRRMKDPSKSVGKRFRMVLLDRDGVINFDSPDYIKNTAEWHAIPGALEAIVRIQSTCKVAICTNQAGIGRGILTADDLADIHHTLNNRIVALGGAPLDIYFCPHHPEQSCGCRKPAPGLLQAAMCSADVAPSETLFVGDSEKDLMAAKAAQCEPVLVLTGNGRDTLSRHTAPYSFAVYADLAGFADSIAQSTRRD